MINLADCGVTEVMFEDLSSAPTPNYPHLWRVSAMGSGPIEFEAWAIIRKTPAGCWVENRWYAYPKLVIHSRKKRWAYPTKAEAWDAWKWRLRKRRMYAQAEFERIAALEAITAKYDKEFSK